MVSTNSVSSANAPAARPRHQRWLHPKRLSYFGVLLLCVLSAPFVALGLGVYFVFAKIGQWLQRLMR